MLSIFETSGAFIVGRQILDEAFIANETIEDYKGRKQEVIFKIDFKKAYDHVD